MCLMPLYPFFYIIIFSFLFNVLFLFFPTCPYLYICNSCIFVCVCCVYMYMLCVYVYIYVCICLYILYVCVCMYICMYMYV